MSDIYHLAKRRAECAARLETLNGFGSSRDPEESREMAIATTKAEREYREAEANFQKMASMMTTSELAALGIAP